MNYAIRQLNYIRKTNWQKKHPFFTKNVATENNKYDATRGTHSPVLVMSYKVILTYLHLDTKLSFADVAEVFCRLCVTR